MQTVADATTMVALIGPLRERVPVSLQTLVPVPVPALVPVPVPVPVRALAIILVGTVDGAGPGAGQFGPETSQLVGVSDTIARPVDSENGLDGTADPLDCHAGYRTSVRRSLACEPLHGERGRRAISYSSSETRYFAIGSICMAAWHSSSSTP